jgi:hypothetical protein
MKTNLDVIVFDASGSLNYENSIFKIINNDQIYKKGLVEFHIYNTEFKIRGNASTVISTNQDLIYKENVLKDIKDNSIVVCQMNYKFRGDDDNIELPEGYDILEGLEDSMKSYIESSGINAVIDHYYGVNLVGSNEFRSRSNIYFMNKPLISFETISEYNLMSTEDASTEYLMAGYLLQAIGRTKYRDLIVKYNNTNTPVDPSDVVHVYFTKDFISSQDGLKVLNILSDKLNAKFNNDMEFSIRLNTLKDSNGKAIRGSVKDKLYKLIDMADNNGVINFDKKYEFRELVGKTDSLMKSYIIYLQTLGYRVSINGLDPSDELYVLAKPI